MDELLPLQSTFLIISSSNPEYQYFDNVPLTRIDAVLFEQKASTYCTIRFGIPLACCLCKSRSLHDFGATMHCSFGVVDMVLFKTIRFVGYKDTHLSPIYMLDSSAFPAILDCWHLDRTFRILNSHTLTGMKQLHSKP